MPRMDTSGADASTAGVRSITRNPKTSVELVPLLLQLPPDYRYTLHVSPGAMLLLRTALEALASKPRMTTYTKARALLMSDALGGVVKRGPLQAQPVGNLVEDINVLEDALASSARERAQIGSNHEPAVYVAEWTRVNGKPQTIDVDLVRAVSATSPADFVAACGRCRRRLPPGAVEWLITAWPGDAASFIDARNDTLVRMACEALP